MGLVLPRLCMCVKERCMRVCAVPVLLCWTLVPSHTRHAGIAENSGISSSYLLDTLWALCRKETFRILYWIFWKVLPIWLPATRITCSTLLFQYDAFLGIVSSFHWERCCLYDARNVKNFIESCKKKKRWESW